MACSVVLHHLYDCDICLLIIGVYGISFWYRSKCVRLRVLELTNYLERVNVGATGTLMQVKEDGFSHLQNEIYKTVTGLYQTREAAVRAKTIPELSIGIYRFLWAGWGLRGKRLFIMSCFCPDI